jgi:hypothetical protein
MLKLLHSDLESIRTQAQQLQQIFQQIDLWLLINRAHRRVERSPESHRDVKNNLLTEPTFWLSSRSIYFMPVRISASGVFTRSIRRIPGRGQVQRGRWPGHHRQDS